VAPALLVLNARIVLDGPEGENEIKLEELFSGDGKAPLNLQPGNILTEVIIPASAMDGVSSYNKFANRDSIDFLRVTINLPTATVLISLFWELPSGHRWTPGSIGWPLPLWTANPSGRIRLNHFWMAKISAKKTLKRLAIWLPRKPNL
jgi:hypothetical protein